MSKTPLSHHAFVFDVLLIFFFSVSYSHISIREAEIPSQILTCLHVWTEADNIQLVEELRSFQKQTQDCSVILLPFWGWADGAFSSHEQQPCLQYSRLVDSIIVSAYIDLHSICKGKHYYAIFIMHINILCLAAY